jgi:hypothetical protein
MIVYGGIVFRSNESLGRFGKEYPSNEIEGIKQVEKMEPFHGR